jgi:hypothetical protein
MRPAWQPAPRAEWVEMYRRGLSAAKIAVLVNTPASTVRYHLQVAKRSDTGLQAEHQAAMATPARRTPKKGLRNLADVLAFHQLTGRLPRSHGKTSRERSLGVWLARRRQEAASGTLSPAYRNALAVIPGWDMPSTRKEEDEARWQQRLAELQDSGPPEETGRGTRKLMTPTNGPGWHSTTGIAAIGDDYGRGGLGETGG